MKVTTKDVEVYENEIGVFECCELGAVGSPIVGRGITIIEAVGEYAIQTQMVKLCKVQKEHKYRLNFSPWDTRE